MNYPSWNLSLGTVRLLKQQQYLPYWVVMVAVNCAWIILQLGAGSIKMGEPTTWNSQWMGTIAFMAIVTLLSIRALCHVTVLLLPRRSRIYSWPLDSRLSLLILVLTNGILAYTTEEGALQKCLHDCTWPCPRGGHAQASLLVPGGMRFMGAEPCCFIWARLA